MHWGRLQAILGTSPVEPAILLICLGGAALTIVVTETTKRLINRH